MALNTFLIIYAAISVVLGIGFVVSEHMSEAKFWQKGLLILLAPLLVLIALGYLIYILPPHIKQNGFKNFYHRKNKAYPLDEDDFKYWAKDTVLVNDQKMSIDEFNKKTGKTVTLDDVYGHGYIDSLTEEDIYHCKSQFDGRFGLQPNMPDSVYKSVSIALAKLITKGGYDDFAMLCSDDCKLLRYGKGYIEGHSNVVEYWNNWLTGIANEKISIMVTVEWCQYYCRPAVIVKPKGYRDMIILFHSGDTTEKIDGIEIAPNPLQRGYVIANSEFKDATYTTKYIDNKTTDNLVDRIENRLFCPICGKESKYLTWKRYAIDMGPRGVAGEVSTCPDCNRVVELYPTTSLRFDENHKSEDDEPFTLEKINAFSPKLYGQYSFDLDIEDEEILLNMGKNQTLFENQVAESRTPEALNRLAISVCENGDSSRAIQLFIEAGEGGCHDAMINLFTLYWSNELDYKSAINYMLYVEKSDNPSLKCLYNLAVLYFYGGNLNGNTLERDIPSAKKVLHQILSIDKGLAVGENEERVFYDAKQFLSLIDGFNIFADNGMIVHDIITKSIVKTESLQDKGELFSRAKSIHPKPGRKLGLYLASDETQDIGDESWFYFYSDEDKAERDKDICSNLLVDNTEMGAWQLYLLMTSPTIMSVFWHGGYICRDFIFSKHDLKNIKPIRNYDFSTLYTDGLLLPTVRLSEDKNAADIYCCYWNDWKGLVREHCQVKFNPDGTASINRCDNFVLYEYDCGILF